mmetsp:Transcript_39231/g.112043  ORF Transcript_39231/g.112043 Transcript_39231/m.112043 type:complete len:222 (-) Transcript_39231:193-858(-)
MRCMQPPSTLTHIRSPSMDHVCVHQSACLPLPVCLSVCVVCRLHFLFLSMTRPRWYLLCVEMPLGSHKGGGRPSLLHMSSLVSCAGEAFVRYCSRCRCCCCCCCCWSWCRRPSNRRTASARDETSASCGASVLSLLAVISCRAFANTPHQRSAKCFLLASCCLAVASLSLSSNEPPTAVYAACCICLSSCVSICRLMGSCLLASLCAYTLRVLSSAMRIET